MSDTLVNLAGIEDRIQGIIEGSDYEWRYFHNPDNDGSRAIYINEYDNLILKIDSSYEQAYHEKEVWDKIDDSYRHLFVPIEHFGTCEVEYTPDVTYESIVYIGFESSCYGDKYRLGFVIQKYDPDMVKLSNLRHLRIRSDISEDDDLYGHGAAWAYNDDSINDRYQEIVLICYENGIGDVHDRQMGLFNGELKMFDYGIDSDDAW